MSSDESLIKQSVLLMCGRSEKVIYMRQHKPYLFRDHVGWPQWPLSPGRPCFCVNSLPAAALKEMPEQSRYLFQGSVVLGRDLEVSS